MRKHLGTSFRVWSRQQSWFWLVLSRHGDGGTIGTAATEADAVREACSSIEQMAAQPASVSSRRPDEAMARLNYVYPCEAAAGWLEWWMSIGDEVTGKIFARWAGLVLRSS
jgi:hypothetical protein